LERDIEASKILHDTLPMMARLDAIVLPICHSGGRDYDRNHPICMPRIPE